MSKQLQRHVDIRKGILKADDEFYTRREDIDAMLPEWDLSFLKTFLETS